MLQSQQRRADAQISYYRALGEYNKSINYVDYLKGTMLANSNITLAEDNWVKIEPAEASPRPIPNFSSPAPVN